jgi:hypothetical protein
MEVVLLKSLARLPLLPPPMRYALEEFATLFFPQPLTHHRLLLLLSF